MATTTELTTIEIARQAGTKDGLTSASEGREDGSYRKGSSSDWDSGLINALGNRNARALFGLKGDASPADDTVYAAALEAYNNAAIKAYDGDDRTIATVKITFDRDSLGEIDANEYEARLTAAVQAMPDVTDETEITVMQGDTTRYEGLYSDSQPWQYDALTERLNQLAEDVFSATCKGE